MRVATDHVFARAPLIGKACFKVNYKALCYGWISLALNPTLCPAKELELEVKAAQLREEDSEREMQRLREGLHQGHAEADHLRQVGLVVQGIGFGVYHVKG